MSDVGFFAALRMTASGLAILSAAKNFRGILITFSRTGEAMKKATGPLQAPIKPQIDCKNMGFSGYFMVCFIQHLLAAYSLFGIPTAGCQEAALTPNSLIVAMHAPSNSSTVFEG